MQTCKSNKQLTQACAAIIAHTISRLSLASTCVGCTLHHHTVSCMCCLCSRASNSCLVMCIGSISGCADPRNGSPVGIAEMAAASEPTHGSKRTSMHMSHSWLCQNEHTQPCMDSKHQSHACFHHIHTHWMQDRHHLHIKLGALGSSDVHVGVV